MFKKTFQLQIIYLNKTRAACQKKPNKNSLKYFYSYPVLIFSDAFFLIEWSESMASFTKVCYCIRKTSLILILLLLKKGVLCEALLKWIHSSSIQISDWEWMRSKWEHIGCFRDTAYLPICFAANTCKYVWSRECGYNSWIKQMFESIEGDCWFVD